MTLAVSVDCNGFTLFDYGSIVDVVSFGWIEGSDTIDHCGWKNFNMMNFDWGDWFSWCHFSWRYVCSWFDGRFGHNWLGFMLDLSNNLFHFINSNSMRWNRVSWMGNWSMMSWNDDWSMVSWNDDWSMMSWNNNWSMVSRCNSGISNHSQLLYFGKHRLLNLLISLKSFLNLVINHSNIIIFF